MRKPRIIFENALYHIISRGNNKNPIFLDNGDYPEYLRLLAEVKDKFSLKIYAYVLMSNHVHILVETPAANISSAMQFLNWNYSKYFNGKYQRCGHLFESRYKSKLVQKDRYLLALVRYIHQNPVVAGVAGSVGDYPWSSYGAYLRDGCVIVERDLVLGLFSNNGKKAIVAYVEFVSSGIP